eukprot:COSAG01_NODE_13357_length_1596_cov_4.113560_2_plen_185_part_00
MRQLFLQISRTWLKDFVNLSICQFVVQIVNNLSICQFVVCKIKLSTICQFVNLSFAKSNCLQQRYTQLPNSLYTVSTTVAKAPARTTTNWGSAVLPIGIITVTCVQRCRTRRWCVLIGVCRTRRMRHGSSCCEQRRTSGGGGFGRCDWRSRRGGAWFGELSNFMTSEGISGGTLLQQCAMCSFS